MEPQNKELQEQIVELRLRIEQQGEAMAALTKHYVEQEVAKTIGGKLLPEKVATWCIEEHAKALARAQDWKDLFKDVFRFGTIAAVSFVALAIYESVKKKLTG